MFKIGISGNKGSFSEQAALYYAQKKNLENYSLVYLTSVKNVLATLTKGEIEEGIFPIENSNGGIVYEAVYAMARYVFQIEEMFEIDIRHCLLALPKAKKEEIKIIASHDQALKQCKMYLRRCWPAAEIKEWADTALAARDLQQGILPPVAAVIAPQRAAEVYGLQILESNIQDLKFNFTTFVAARKR